MNFKINYYQRSNKSVRTNTLINLIAKLKKLKNYEWLQEVDSQALTQSVRNLDTAYTKFFREKKGFPNFKKRGNKESCKITQHIYIDFENQKIKLPKIGWCKLRIDREFKGQIRSATVSKIPCGKYFVSILVDTGIEKSNKVSIKKSTSIGIDVGLKTFATCSDGAKFDNPKHLQRLEQRLKVLQRCHSKKRKGSNNKNKSRIKLAKLHYKISCQRKDFLHKLTSKLVSENQTIIIEDLNVSGILKNHCLAKAISSASWSEFFRQLQYKCDWSGKNLVRIGRFEPSSQICNKCGCQNQTLTLADREWYCLNCNLMHDRDVNAAKNILAIGLYNSG